MSNILPQQSGLVGLPAPFTYNLAVNPSAATHYSHTGIGGFIEFPTIDYRNDIPIDSGETIGDDQMSSGRRKIGMIVYVKDINKFYQLIPNVGGVPITQADWLAKSTAEKLVALNPMASVFDAEITFDMVTGTGNPDDAWVEISIPRVENNVLSSNGTVTNIITCSEADYNALVIAGTTNPQTMYVIL